MATAQRFTTATVKSPFLSKTNITAAVMLLLGLAGLVGILPDNLVNEQTGGTVVAIGSALVIAFRTFSNSVLGRS
jgi:hypothetical protein